MNSERYVVLGLGFFLSIWNKFDTLTLMYLMVFIFWILLSFYFALKTRENSIKNPSYIYIDRLWFLIQHKTLISLLQMLFIKRITTYWFIELTMVYFENTIHVQNYKFSLLNVCKCIIPISARTIHMDARKVSQFETCTVPDGLHL